MMQCLVFVKFLPGGSVAPEEFFEHINAKFSWIEGQDCVLPEGVDFYRDDYHEFPKMAICVAEIESIEQLAIDLSIMPGAGISNIEVMPFYEKEKLINTSLTRSG